MAEKAYALRVSVLEQCQLNCRYCLPGKGRKTTLKEKWLRIEEYGQLARVFAKTLSLHKIRFTGGEPLLRPGIAEIISRWRSEFPQASLGITTNGLRLPQYAKALYASGIRAVTIHLDTLQEERMGKLMGNGSVAQIRLAVEIARTIFPIVKINMVVQNGENQDELSSFLSFAAEHKVEVRFIEQMNTGSAKSYTDETFISGQKILDQVAVNQDFVSIKRRNKSDPARLYELLPSKQLFGLIASDTMPFCDSCDRIRLTASGTLKDCLYAGSGLSLASLLRQNKSDKEIGAALLGAVEQKSSSHPMRVPLASDFSMADVGG